VHGNLTDEPSCATRVVAFQDLAETAAISLAKGMTVTVTGEPADDSWITQPIPR
jgi:single-stranded DNA-binding protein